MPHRNIKDLHNLRLSLDKLTNGKPKHVIIAGDFNCPDLDCVNMEIKTGASDREVQQALLDITSEYGLTQIHDKPTRKGNMLDLVFTNNPSLIKTTGNAPGISDHDTVITDSIIKPHYCKQQTQKRYIFSKANWEKIKTDITEIAKDINNNINSKDINYSWNQLKHGIVSTVDQNVQSKMIKKKHHIPWLNRSLKRMLRRKARLHKHAKRTGNFKEYRQFQKECKRQFRKAEWDHINNIILELHEIEKTRQYRSSAT
jgi:hypothetical protein